MKRTIYDLLKDKELPVGKRTRSKKTPTFKPFLDEKIWISATEFDAFCQNDPIIDWLSHHQKNSSIEMTESTSLSFLFEKGREHEDAIVNILRLKTGLSLEKHSSLTTSRQYNDYNDKKDSERVIDSMRKGIPLIYSAYLSDHKEGLRGIPDLLVRNDYLSTLFEMNTPEVEDGSSYFGDYYYLPIEIKFSSLHLTSNGKYLLNSGRSSFYKTQLFVYCKLLENIQGFLPTSSLLIGKRTVMSSGMVHHSLVYPGLVDYTNHDNNIVSSYQDGLRWLRRVKSVGLGWESTLDMIKKNHLYPNMKSKDSIYHNDKKQIAESYGEITEIWQCSVKHREIAISKGIYSWKDPNLTADVMNIPDSYKKEVDLFLKINRGELGDYHPLYLSKESRDKLVGDDSNEMFVDFETVRDSFDVESCNGDLNGQEWIFLIGVYYKGVYRSFILSELTSDCEKEILINFLQYWKESGYPTCLYWYAEHEFMRRALIRHPSLEVNRPIQWLDLHDVVRHEPFVVKGCKNFKLKSYVSALSHLGKIEIESPPETCGDGLNAMVIAWKHYFEDRNDKAMEDVISYNKFDCIALYKIKLFLKSL